MVEEVKCNILRWFVHIERITEIEMTKRVGLFYMSVGDASVHEGDPPWNGGDRMPDRKGWEENKRIRIGINGDLCHGYPIGVPSF